MAAAAAAAAAAGAGARERGSQGDDDVHFAEFLPRRRWSRPSWRSAAPMAAHAEPQSFASPEAAADAVIAALKAKDRDALLAVFGPESADVIFTGDDAEDRADWGQFLASYEAMHRIAVDKTEAGERATLYIGRDQWPFPVELVARRRPVALRRRRRARGGAAAADRRRTSST